MRCLLADNSGTVSDLALKVIITCLFMFPPLTHAAALNLQPVEHKAAHIYQHREGFDGAGGRSQQSDGVGPVFTAICANGPVYIMQDSSVDRGRRRTTLENHSAFLALGTDRGV